MRIELHTCTVRSWRKSDAEALTQFANNRNVWINVRDHFPHPYEISDARRWLVSVIDANPETNFAMPKPGTRTRSFEFAETAVKMKCDVHPWMGAWVHVMTHPFHAVTGDDGSYTIKGVPAGTHTLVMWHAKFGEQKTQVTVASQQTAGDGPCLGCHGTGTGSFYANTSSQLSFQVNKDDAYFLQKYITCSFEAGAFSDLVPSERVKNKGTEPCAGEPCHPTFVLTTERQTAIETFVGDTIAAWKAGSCN